MAAASDNMIQAATPGVGDFYFLLEQYNFYRRRRENFQQVLQGAITGRNSETYTRESVRMQQNDALINFFGVCLVRAAERLTGRDDPQKGRVKA